MLFSVLLLAAGLAYADDSTTPMQVRLAYSGPTGMVVSWNTYSQLDSPTVNYGLFPDMLIWSASSNVSVTYPTSTTFNNHVKLSNLLPDTQYYYQLPDSNVTTPASFRTSRSAGDKQPFTVALAIDLGTMGVDGLTTYTGKGASHALAPGERNTIQALNDSVIEYDFLWHPGDIAYADAWLKEEIGGFLPANDTVAKGTEVYERILNDFYDQMEPITSIKPYMVAPGNHEANCDNGGTTDKTKNITYTEKICMPGQTNFTGYRNHFRMPSDVSGGLENFWYSWDHGMVHFITLDTETDLGHGYISPDAPGGVQKDNEGPFASYMNQQTDWLTQDLAAVDRTKTPWVVVGLHRPWYVNQPNASLCLSCQAVFEPLFLNYSVDLVVTGHVHAYQRNAPLYNGQADPAELNNPTYPWYITNGAAGHYDGLDTLSRPFTNYTRSTIEGAYGWSRLVFHNETHLTQEFVSSANGSVMDSATLYKERNSSSSQGASVSAKVHVGPVTVSVGLGLGL